MNRTTILRIAILWVVIAVTSVMCLAEGGDHALAVTTVTNATGSIAQLNYSDAGGAVDGFLIGSNTLLAFPSSVCGGVSSLGAVGNSVTYSGSSVSYSSGFDLVSVTSFKNNTTGASYTQPTRSKPTAYSATSGAVKQLNYQSNGSINGFVFTPNGTTSAILVATGPVSSALKTALTLGATVSVTGTLESSIACAPGGTLSVVDASSLMIGSTTYKIGGGGLFSGLF
jgi:hypothetical protein